MSEPKAGDAVRWFVEQFALLADSGLPRMAARVFAYLLVGDSQKHTVGQIAAGLGMSPAAVSSAVRRDEVPATMERWREHRRNVLGRQPMRPAPDSPAFDVRGRKSGVRQIAF